MNCHRIPLRNTRQGNEETKVKPGRPWPWECVVVPSPLHLHMHTPTKCGTVISAGWSSTWESFHCNLDDTIYQDRRPGPTSRPIVCWSTPQLRYASRPERICYITWQSEATVEEEKFPPHNWPYRTWSFRGSLTCLLHHLLVVSQGGQGQHVATSAAVPHGHHIVARDSPSHLHDRGF